MKNIFQSILLLCSSILFLVACSSKEPQSIEIGDNERETIATTDNISITQSQFQLVKMELGQLSDYNFPSTIRATGQLEIPTKNHLKVSAYTGGYVTNINLVPGQRVGKGQVLLTLENPELVQMQQDYLEAKEQLTYLQSDYERQKTLAKENIAAQKNYLKAESDYRVTLTKMKGMKKRLSLLNIKTEDITAQNLVSTISVNAPASGYITEVYAMKGMFLNPTDVAVELLNTNDMHLELNVFEKDILKIKEGQAVTFRIPNASTTTYQATVHLTGKTIDEEKRVVRVHADLNNKKDKESLVAGMYVDAEIITEAMSTKGLPETAIVTEDEQNYVLIQIKKAGDDYLFEKRAVTTGQRKGGFVEVVNLKDFVGTESILVKGAFNLIGIE